ncbi:LEM domain-containing protein 1 isoform X3 [Acinonyx jubatus]|uniref:LEM domain-containing protein 1 isoform X3 n=1 Tax=Acinonyx jubatus TaxID=32536 RepID=A0ABM3P0U1_ACIJB|nr:LEM domain-containing protein 1 isoform X3 [Acinonyx jubatus]
MVDVKCLSDYELQNKLNKLGYSPGPILPSTRKAYEKKLVQLLVSPPSVSPVMNGPRELDRAQDDDAKELKTTIILKGNILLSSEKHKGPKKLLTWDMGTKLISVDSKPAFVASVHLHGFTTFPSRLKASRVILEPPLPMAPHVHTLMYSPERQHLAHSELMTTQGMVARELLPLSLSL